jgi:hypothetical protein
VVKGAAAMSIEALIEVAFLLPIVGWFVLDWYMGWTQRMIDIAIQELEEEEFASAPDWVPEMIDTLIVILLAMATVVAVAIVFGL